jgi:CHAT domain-containing protein
MEAPAAAAVLEKVTTCSLVHFACHGSSDAEQPSKSALLLGRRSVDKLTVEDLQSLNYQLAQVAYLSACSTADVGAWSLIDESIHLSSTFQLVGFRHVIGTLWGADDSAAVAVAAKFYEYLFKEDADTVSSVPHALHRAVLDLKTKDGNSDDISLWAPFIHLGP